MSLVRTIRAWFTTPTTAKDRFVTNDKPTQANFRKLFESVPFVAEKDDTAKETEQGLAKTTTDAYAIAKAGPSQYTDGMTRFIEAYQLPDVIAEDASVTITEVIYDATDGVIVGAVVAGHDCRKQYKIAANDTSYVEEWKTFGAGGTMANGEAVPELGAQTVATTAGRLRRYGKAHVEVQFTGTVIVPDTINYRGMFVLPAAGTGLIYRPTVEIRYPVCGQLTDGSANWSGYIIVATSGVVTLFVVDPAFVVDTEVNLSYCILIPID